MKDPSGLLMVLAATVESLRRIVMVADGMGCLPSVTFPVRTDPPGFANAAVTGCGLVWAKVCWEMRSRKAAEQIKYFMGDKVIAKWF